MSCGKHWAPTRSLKLSNAEQNGWVIAVKNSYLSTITKTPRGVHNVEGLTTKFL
jgi:hypothetical protein